MSQDLAKKVAAEKATDFIQNEMIVGLGSGTTSHFFIEALAKKVQKGLNIQCVASSKESANLAKKRGLLVFDINQVPYIDITVDGADEIDPQKRMIKGGGGAHVREKILASSSHQMVVMIDESKLVEKLGKAKLPVEILFFGAPSTRAKLEKLGYKGSWRLKEDQTFFVTENGNLLFDIHFPHLLDHPEKEEQTIRSLAGVVDTGFFFNLASFVIVGSFQGKTKEFEQPK